MGTISLPVLRRGITHVLNAGFCGARYTLPPRVLHVFCTEATPRPHRGHTEATPRRGRVKLPWTCLSTHSESLCIAGAARRLGYPGAVVCDLCVREFVGLSGAGGQAAHGRGQFFAVPWMYLIISRVALPSHVRACAWHMHNNMCMCMCMWTCGSSFAHERGVRQQRLVAVRPADRHGIVARRHK